MLCFPDVAMVTDLRIFASAKNRSMSRIAVTNATIRHDDLCGLLGSSSLFLLSIGISDCGNLGSNFCSEKSLPTSQKRWRQFCSSPLPWTTPSSCGTATTRAGKRKTKRLPWDARLPSTASVVGSSITTIAGFIALAHDLYAGAGSWPCRPAGVLFRCRRLRHNAALCAVDS